MSNTDSNTNQPRLLSFTLDGWSVLGGRVTVSLHDGVAVLVGRNGSGKSAIIEGLEAISLCAIVKSKQVPYNNGDSIPKILEIQVLTPTHRLIAYKFELVQTTKLGKNLNVDTFTSDNLEGEDLLWNEHCQYTDGDNEILWTTTHGLTRYKKADGSTDTFLGNMYSARQAYYVNNLSFPNEIYWINTVLTGIRLINKTFVRQTSGRRESLLKVSQREVISINGISGINGLLELADSLALRIRRMESREVDELNSICQRIGIGEITLQKFILSEPLNEKEYILSVQLDSVNIGLLSDGTLKVLSILIEIITLKPSSTIIIEEPEAQIHPAMLARLLNEIETYTYGQNLIISTHSPQVVSWSSPEKINLVHRKDGRTFVRKLGEAQIHNVIEYLSEEGNLGEWVYSGILDE
ncbi:AAA family ATPase [Pseudanabaena sp. UWO310]|uniref:AAA family ATPase n=1 Tax=Pseudanabaena sp. UWO310 TaxID=2480795 RepID=UPI001158D034|nr:ATP-binding protein [Pseudanabaena sp. UWO310]TYQ31112.1 AAA family ATPase [Pseudanabaena sp. UWO310]